MQESNFFYKDGGVLVIAVTYTLKCSLLFDKVCEYNFSTPKERKDHYKKHVDSSQPLHTRMGGVKKKSK